MLAYQKGELLIEQCGARSLADVFGTPCYVYSKAAVLDAVMAYQRAYTETQMRFLLCYSVKANSNIHILRLLVEQGCGFDIVSGGELERVLLAGSTAQKIVFSGVGKRRQAIERALEVGIACFNVESIAELYTINQCALAIGTKAPVAIRINPAIDAQTHPYIATGLQESKFGIDIERAYLAYQEASRLEAIDIVGIDCHIGSQITTLSPFENMLDSLVSMITQLAMQGIKLKYVDIGGGVGIRYQNELPISIDAMAALVAKKLAHLKGITLLIEPGRSIVGNAGALLTQCIVTKQNYDTRFVVVDAAMNDLLRPALYQAHHAVWPAIESNNKTAVDTNVSLVGEVCESGDVFAKNLPIEAQQGDVFAIASVGAYGFCMASNYNSRPRAAEVLVSQTNASLIRERETFADLIARETACTPLSPTHTHLNDADQLR